MWQYRIRNPWPGNPSDICDANGNRLMRTANTAAVSVDYVWLDDLPVAQFQDSYDAQGVYIGTEATYLHSDHLGTPRIGTNASKQITWRNRSDAFGIADLSGSAVVRLRFPGQLSLGVAGLNYNYYRDYDPKVGRYVESDPIGLEGGLNTYGYVAQNPLRFMDPSGLDIKVCFFPEGITHVGFGSSGDGPTYGFYPQVGFPWAFGEVREDPKNEPQECKTVPSTRKQDRCMNNCRLARQREPGFYRIGDRQCTSFVRDCMRQCGIATGIARSSDPWQGPRPRRFFDALPSAPLPRRP
jgi:RHS repeat-associated protein